MINSTVDISFPGMEGLKREISSTAQRTELLNKWADTYFQSMNARHNTLSKGVGSPDGQQWRSLAAATVDKRKRRLHVRTDRSHRKEQAPQRGPYAILTDTLQLLAATRKKGGPGQLRLFNVESFVATLGIGGPTLYKDPTKRKTQRTLGTIAYYLAAKGRRIIVPPNARTVNKMETDAAIWVLKRKRGR